MKTLTRQQVEQRKEKAVAFTRDVRDDPERAAEIEDESLEDYAARKKIQIQNPGRFRMASKRELEERVQELEEENDDLNDRLDQVADLAGVEEEEEEEQDMPVPNRRR